MPIPAETARGIKDVICLVVAATFDVPVEAMLNRNMTGRGRGFGHRVMLARQVAMYLTHICGINQRTVGDLFNRTKRRVGQACHAVEDMRDGPFDEVLNNAELAIKALLEARGQARTLPALALCGPYQATIEG